MTSSDACGRVRTLAAEVRGRPGNDATKDSRLVSDLIDTTEMYLRTIFELEEEGITPLRARIA